jgi:xylan 1,4-beta-xylosidase
MLASGVRDDADIDVLATRDDHGVSLLVWNYQDDDGAGPGAAVNLAVQGLPVGVRRLLMKHYRIDANHSNAFSVWKSLGSPAAPTPDQQRQLEQAGQLQLLDSPNWLWNTSGTVSISFDLPRQAVSLLRIEW